MLFTRNKINIDNYKYFLKSIFSSSHLNFLFGAGVNGKLFPQTNSEKIKKEFRKIIKNYNDSIGLEENISSLYDDNQDNWKEYEIKIIEIFKKYNDEAMNMCNFNNNDFLDFYNLLKKIVEIIEETDNRNLSMHELNIFTLNYDTIIDKILENLNIEYMVYDNKNIVTKSHSLETISYDYTIKKFFSKINVFKIHGNIKNSNIVIPSYNKYEEIIKNSYFEILSTFKRKMERSNSILVTIGYGYGDMHINNLISNYIQKQVLLINFNYGEKISKNFDIFKNNIKSHSEKIINIPHSEKINSTNFLFDLLNNNVLKNEK